jgi:2-methylcitrate dehydratase PrpD
MNHLQQNSMEDAGVTRQLAQFIVESKFDTLPSSVVAEASRAIVNCLGCAIGAAQHDTVNFAMDALSPFFGSPQAQIWGRSERADILHAALINGISTHVLDFDDTHFRAVHPSAPVLPAIFALAEWRQFSGKELVHAYVLGVEAEIRIALSVFPEHYDRGWHITGTAGVFGAAVAAGKLLNLNVEQMTWALGIAATQSSGLREMFGTMCKSFHPGHAAQGGLAAALMAEKGFTSSTRALEAKRGFGQVMSSRFDPSVITNALGAEYELSKNMYKPFACGLVVHAVIDACLQLRHQHHLKAEDIALVKATVGPLVLELTGIKQPKTGLEGKFSVYHAMAVAIIYGAAGEAQFSSEVVCQPDVAKLRSLIEVEVDPTVRKLEGYVTVILKDGREIACHVSDALGSLAHPMSNQDLEAKFRSLTANILNANNANQLLDQCWNIAQLDDVGSMMRLTSIQ